VRFQSSQRVSDIILQLVCVQYKFEYFKWEMEKENTPITDPSNPVQESEFA